MAIVRFGILLCAAAPIILVPILSYYAPFLFTGGKEIDALAAWSLIGTFLSYYGLIFSLYAATEVRNLSQKYVFRIRSPEIQKKLRSISSKVGSFSEESCDDLHFQSFIHEAPVVLRAARRTKNKEVNRVAKEAERELSNLKKESGRIERNSGLKAGEIKGYWGFFQKISELSDEVKTQLEDTRVTQ